MLILVRHSTIDMQCANVLRYFGRKVSRSGEIPRSFQDTLQSDLKRREKRDRVKFRMNGNSAKFYDKAHSDIGSVFRVETTLNNVKGFKAYRPKQGGAEDDLLDALARTDDSRTVEEITACIQQPTQWQPRRVRALLPWGRHHDLLQAISRGDFLLSGLRNRDLQAILYQYPAASSIERRRRSAATQVAHAPCPWPDPKGAQNPLLSNHTTRSHRADDHTHHCQDQSPRTESAQSEGGRLKSSRRTKNSSPGSTILSTGEANCRRGLAPGPLHFRSIADETKPANIPPIFL